MEWRHAPLDTERGRVLYPVSVPFDPPFTVMTHLTGQGDRQVKTLCCGHRERPVCDSGEAGSPMQS